MPTNVVKTQADEEKWQKAKAIAAAKGEGENYAYIMGIYKRMNPERFAAARVADRYATSPLIKELDEDYHSLWHERAEVAGEGWTCSLKEGVDPCGKMTLKEFIAKWKKHGLKAVKVQRLPTTYSYYDCSSHATLRTEQMHGVSRGNLRDLELDWNTPIPWSKAKKGDWVKWPNHHGVVIDPKRKIVESCWGVDGWVFQHPVDLSIYGGKPTVHSVRLKEKTASKEAAPNKKARHVVAYHGSNVPIRRFDRSKAAMGVFWFSEDKGAVERGEKANRTDWLMTARLDVGDKIAGWEEYDKLGLYELERQFDSVKLDDDWIIFDPSKIKVTKTEKIDRGRRASPTRVAMRSKSSGSVRVEVLPRPTEKARKSYGKTIAVGRFKSSIPLFRVMDGEELRQVWDTGDIKGGEYSVPGERAFGAQWGASLPEVAKWGDTQRGKRLGHELFVAEIDGKGRVFAHLNGANGQLQPDSGTVDLDSSFCNTGLGCSTHVQKRKVKQWYVVDENGSPRKVTAAEIDDMLNEVGWKPRKVTLWMGHHFNRLPSKIAKALAWETLQMEATHAKSREEKRDLRRRQYELGAKPLDKDKLGRLLFSYLGKEAPAWWETASSVAETDALPSRANGTDSFAVMFSVVANTVVPYQGADMPRVGEAQAKQIELYIPALKRWERIWSPWGKGAPLTFTDDAIFVGR